MRDESKQQPKDDDPIVFQVRQRFTYNGARIETLTRDQLIALLKRILRLELFN